MIKLVRQENKSPSFLFSSFLFYLFIYEYTFFFFGCDSWQRMKKSNMNLSFRFADGFRFSHNLSMRWTVGNHQLELEIIVVCRFYCLCVSCAPSYTRHLILSSNLKVLLIRRSEIRGNSSVSGHAASAAIGCPRLASAGIGWYRPVAPFPAPSSPLLNPAAGIAKSQLIIPIEPRHK